MRLSLERDFSGQRGWSNFIGKLVNKLASNHGVKLVDKNSKSDIHLSVVSGYKKGSKNIVRVDGVYYDNGRKARNTSISNSIKTSDGVVFQSEWSRTFATRMLGVSPRKSCVIFNGVEQSESQKATKIKLDFAENWVCCAHWRVNKRPQSIARAFIAAKEQTKKDIGLYFLGAFKYEDLKIQHPSIRYLNEVPHDKLYSYFVSSNWMCHICHVDSCPNSVVEGLSCGLPVLCNNIGGTPEIVGTSGLVVPLDKPFEFKYLNDWDVTGSKYVNDKLLSDGMINMMSQEWKVSRPDLDISVAAQKYYNFFLEILKG